MKTELMTVVVAVVILFCASLFANNNVSVVVESRAHIQMTSDPYPLVIGPSQLFFAVLDAAGNPVDATSLELDVEMTHDGMLPLYAPVTKTGFGQFSATVQWSMAGSWTVSAEAVLADGSTMDDSFQAYVYSTTTAVGSYQTQFRSARQDAALITDPQRELAIIIPQGTRAMMLSGMLEEVIPDEIHLSVSGQNTLIIHNNDIVDHVVGPFSIHVGETIRQKFNAPQFFQGVCSATATSVVSIIVDE
ncbi:MAG: FixH family protein [Anaerolineae bacterium]